VKTVKKFICFCHSPDVIPHAVKRRCGTYRNFIQLTFCKRQVPHHRPDGLVQDDRCVSNKRFTQPPITSLKGGRQNCETFKKRTARVMVSGMETKVLSVLSECPAHESGKEVGDTVTSPNLEPHHFQAVKSRRCVHMAYAICTTTRRCGSNGGLT